MRWPGHVARMVERRGVYRVLVGKPEGKRTLGKPRRRWEDNIRTDLQEVGLGGVWTGSTWVKVGTGGGHLWRGWWTFGFRKMRGIFWLAENRLAAQEGLCSLKQSTSKAGSVTTLEVPQSVLAPCSPNQTPPTLSGEFGRSHDFVRIRCHCIHSIRMVICYTHVSFMCWLSSKLYVSLSVIGCFTTKWTKKQS